MKKTRLLISCVLALTTIVFAGCGTKFGQSVDRMLFRPTKYVTNNVPDTIVQVKTNQVVVIVQTNALGQVVGSVTNREPVTIPVLVPAHQEVVPTAWEANPAVTSTISTVGSFVPGYGTLIGWGATALLGIAAAIRSGKYKDAAVSVAQGVEHYMAANPSSVPALKTTMAAVQADHGTTSTVRDIMAKDVESTPTVGNSQCDHP